MIPVLQMLLRWLLDASAAAALLFTLVAVLLMFVREPIQRRHMITWTLGLGILLAVVQTSPLGARWSLALYDVHAPRTLPWLAAAGGPGGNMPAFSNGMFSVGTYLRVRAWLPDAAVAAYLLMAAFLLVRALAGAWHIGRLRRTSMPASRRVRELMPELGGTIRISPNVSRPIVFGLWHPVVLLPAGMVAGASDAELQAILAHEAAHVRGGDLGRRILCMLTVVLFFPLPPLWVLLRSLRLSQEQLADHAAAAGDPLSYAGMLLRLAGGRQTRGEAALGAWRRPSETFLRIRFLLGTREGPQTRCPRVFTITLAAVLLATGVALGTMTLTDTRQSARVRTAELKGVGYLLSRQQTSGGWLGEFGPAPTALIMRSLLQAGVPVDHPALVRARRYLDSTQRADGGFYNNSTPSYQTAVVLSLYSALHDDAAQARMVRGRAFLAALGDSESHNPIDDTCGSASALNWRSLAYADLGENDPAVTAAARWLATRWTVAYHPGTRDEGQEAHYYYLMASTRIFAAAAPGNLAHWRSDTNGWLLGQQLQDGEWINKRSDRWLEDHSELVTAYALLALQAAREP